MIHARPHSAASAVHLPAPITNTNNTTPRPTPHRYQSSGHLPVSSTTTNAVLHPQFLSSSSAHHIHGSGADFDTNSSGVPEQASGSEIPTLGSFWARRRAANASPDAGRSASPTHLEGALKSVPPRHPGAPSRLLPPRVSPPSSSRHHHNQSRALTSTPTSGTRDSTDEDPYATQLYHHNNQNNSNHPLIPHHPPSGGPSSSLSHLAHSPSPPPSNPGANASSRFHNNASAEPIRGHDNDGDVPSAAVKHPFVNSIKHTELNGLLKRFQYAESEGEEEDDNNMDNNDELFVGDAGVRHLHNNRNFALSVASDDNYENDNVHRRPLSGGMTRDHTTDKKSKKSRNHRSFKNDEDHSYSSSKAPPPLTSFIGASSFTAGSKGSATSNPTNTNSSSSAVVQPLSLSFLQRANTNNNTLDNNNSSNLLHSVGIPYFNSREQSSSMLIPGGGADGGVVEIPQITSPYGGGGAGGGPPPDGSAGSVWGDPRYSVIAGVVGSGGGKQQQLHSPLPSPSSHRSNSNGGISFTPGTLSPYHPPVPRTASVSTLVPVLSSSIMRHSQSSTTATPSRHSALAASLRAESPMHRAKSVISTVMFMKRKGSTKKKENGEEEGEDDNGDDIEGPYKDLLPPIITYIDIATDTSELEQIESQRRQDMQILGTTQTDPPPSTVDGGNLPPTLDEIPSLKPPSSHIDTCTDDLLDPPPATTSNGTQSDPPPPPPVILTTDAETQVEEEVVEVVEEPPKKELVEQCSQTEKVEEEEAIAPPHHHHLLSSPLPPVRGWEEGMGLKALATSAGFQQYGSVVCGMGGWQPQQLSSHSNAAASQIVTYVPSGGGGVVAPHACIEKTTNPLSTGDGIQKCINLDDWSPSSSRQMATTQTTQQQQQQPTSSAANTTTTMDSRQETQQFFAVTDECPFESSDAQPTSSVVPISTYSPLFSSLKGGDDDGQNNNNDSNNKGEDAIIGNNNLPPTSSSVAGKNLLVIDGVSEALMASFGSSHSDSRVPMPRFDTAPADLSDLDGGVTPKNYQPPSTMAIQKTKKESSILLTTTQERPAAAATSHHLTIAAPTPMDEAITSVTSSPWGASMATFSYLENNNDDTNNLYYLRLILS